MAMRKGLLASVSAAALSCSVAMPAQATPPTPVYNWTGFYVGANVGAVWGNSNPTQIDPMTEAPFFHTVASPAPPGLSPSGFIGGGQAGYNGQTGQWVFGGEVDFSGLNAKADATMSPFFGGKGTFTNTWSSQYDWLFTARLRGGFTVVPNWLLYATGGLAVTHVRDSVTCTSTSNGCVDFPGTGESVTWSDSKTLAGGTIGGGIETMFSPNWTARVEYLYAKFQDTTPGVTSTTTVSGVLPPIPPVYSFHHDLNLVRFAINYKFGG
jgi:outer membrane immunogenic protein